MGLSKEDLDQFIAAERAALRTALPGKLLAMESLWRGNDSASLVSLERMAHSLYGSTGTFGMRDTSAACKALEQAVQAFIQDPSPTQRQAAEAALARLRVLIDAMPA